MRLSLEALDIIDFKAFRGGHKFRLDLPGVTNITGDNRATPSLAANGAAKSTLWDAVLWCLYGRTALGLRNADVKPWAGGRTSVALTLSVDDRRHVIERNTSPNRFTCDGEDIPDIGAVFDLGFELAVNTIILPQGRELFLQRSPRDKMALFSEAMPLEKWDTRSIAASKATALLEQEAITAQADVARRYGVLQEIDRNITNTKALAADWQDAARKRIRASDKELAALKKTRITFDSKLSEAALKEDGALTELRACDATLRKLRTRQASVEAGMAACYAKIKILSNECARLNDERAALSKAKLCPTCGQPVKQKDLTQQKADLDQNHNEVSVELEQCVAAKDVFFVEQRDNKRKLERIEKEANDFDEKARTAGDVILRTRSELATLDQKIAAATPKDETNPHTQQIADLNARHKKLMAVQEAKESDLWDIKAQAERTKYWVKGFKEIKLQLIEDVLSELELVANGMIDEVGLDGWQIKFDIERESKSGSIQNMINVEVMSPESKEKIVKWESFSGGELQRLRLVGSLALADVLLSHAGIETNLEVLDEPAVYWAGEGVQELVAFLATRARERDKSIYFIEHSAVESVHFSRVWNIVKDKSGARLAGAKDERKSARSLQA